MAYSTVEDLKTLVTEKALIQLTDDEGLGAFNQVRVDEAIARADAEIEAYCRERYEVPFEDVPELVRNISADIAIYNLFSRRVTEMPELWAERYRNSIKRLEGISRGTISLITAASGTSGSEGGVGNSREPGDRTVSLERLKGY